MKPMPFTTLMTGKERKVKKKKKDGENNKTRRDWAEKLTSESNQKEKQKAEQIIAKKHDRSLADGMLDVTFCRMAMDFE